MKKQQIKLIKYDLIAGFRYNLKKYIILILFVAACCSVYYVQLNDSIDQLDEIKAGYLDYVIEMLMGSPSFNLATGLKIPIQLIGIHIIIGSVVGYYPFDDINGYGKQIFIRTSKKSKWWNSKVIWCMTSVVFSYVLIFLTIFLFCLFTGQSIISSYHPEMFEITEQVYIGGMHFTSVVAYMFILPVVYSCFASLLQVSLSMIIGPILSFLVNMFLLFLGIVVTTPLILINYAMLLRNYMISGVNITGRVGLVVLCLGLAVTYFVGRIFVNKKELY